ncbi:corrinoid protein [Halanaerobiaceae bacterium Z-7014]|uniref:Corrinoid protein n=1 Tax=Halonatronomonas betaini TaxID=2778430 RepID=A0A931FAZ3_9FIRM|nr:corrinoid protein [Halonatronomonas betaini]MBF8438164.1 corrinoid protein [Halonatronomonas betaini]
MADFEKLSESVIKGEEEKVKELVQEAIDEGLEPSEIINQGLISGMNVVGKRFKEGDMFVPEVLLSARSMKGGMELVKPLLVEGEMEEAGKVILGTVEGDLHDIGKNLVGMMMESGGLEVINLGTDVTAAEFAEAVREHKPDVLGMSALLTTTMLEMQNTIEVLIEEGLRDSVKIIVGGAPVTKEFADEIGADGWAPDAASAKDLVFELAEVN